MGQSLQSSETMAGRTRVRVVGLQPDIDDGFGNRNNLFNRFACSRREQPGILHIDSQGNWCGNLCRCQLS